MANIEVTQGSANEVPAATAADERLPLGPVIAAIGAAIAAGLGKDEYDAAKAKLREVVARDPIDSLLATVLGGGLLFYTLEKGKNPRCNTYWDAVLYVATSLSVGYDDVFPKTAAGNALAAAVQTFGPALAAGAFDAPQPSPSAGTDAEALAVNKAILARLDEIAALLRDK